MFRFSGGVRSTGILQVDIKLLLSIALGCLASKVIISHNYPSDSLKPSRADRHLTRQVSDACFMMGITLLDHLIISRKGCYSFAGKRASNEYWVMVMRIE
ncbi:MAG: JAB domain-containing protein [Daejeonella sp.]